MAPPTPPTSAGPPIADDAYGTSSALPNVTALPSKDRCCASIQTESRAAVEILISSKKALIQLAAEAFEFPKHRAVPGEYGSRIPLPKAVLSPRTCAMSE